MSAAGLPSSRALLASFDLVERETRQLASIPADSGLLGHLVGTAFGWRMRSERALVAGDDAHSRLSRAGYHLEAGDLSRAVSELEAIGGLPARGGTRLQQWLVGARSRLAVQQATDLVRAHLRLVAASQANIVAAKHL